MKTAVKQLTFLSIALIAQPTFAQQKPDAGQILQERDEVLKVPETPASIGIEIDTPMSTRDGAMVTVKNVTFKGNTVFTNDNLLKAIGNLQEKTLSLGEIKDLAIAVTNFYRTNGYPFAKAIIPPQEITSGELAIQIFEGQYGEIRLVGDEELTTKIKPYTAPFKTGNVISSHELERVTQIIDELPGIIQTPIIRPSQTRGAGDLVIDIKEEKKISGSVGVDNYGNAYTGRFQNNLALNVNRVFTVGDQFSFLGMLSEENMYLGSVNYSAPLMPNGLRATAGFTHTFYQLKKEFSYLDASGRANVFSTGLSYPIIKSQNRNLPVSLTFSHKRLTDKQNAFQVKEYKSVNTAALTFSGDNRDRFLGYGITYGTAGVTLGKLSMDHALDLVDQTTANSAGGFLKYNLNIARLQVLPANFHFFQEFGVQVASRNLDSSEGFGIGGKSGVRAYPSGEGYGDEGFTSQTEIRYNLSNLSPFVFFDYGRSTYNHAQYSASSNHRNIAGTGAGVRGHYKDLSGSFASAWRTQGGSSLSYSKNYVPMMWFELEYKF